MSPPSFNLILILKCTLKCHEVSPNLAKSTVHEDNMGALRLAQLEPGRNTPRSKFYAIKFHWFRSWLKPKSIELEYIESKNQKADILTKSLGTVAFEENRFLSCGW